MKETYGSCFVLAVHDAAAGAKRPRLDRRHRRPYAKPPKSSGFVHVTESTERIVAVEPNTIDACDRRLQLISRPQLDRQQLKPDPAFDTCPRSAAAGCVLERRPVPR
jgi:hypothetical protein